MSDEKFLPSSYGLETTEATLAHYEAWAGSYDAEIGEENRYAQPGRCTRALLASGVGPAGTASPEWHWPGAAMR